MIQERPARSAAGLTLLCFPHAGGSATSYGRWVHAMPGTKVVPVELPGRGERIREQPHDRMEPLVTELARTLLPHLADQFALFGHSMGALIAFELAHRLRQQYGLRPTRLVGSGCEPPGSRPRPARLRHLLPDDELWEEVLALNGTSDAVYANEELRTLYTPAVRADFALVENYSCAARYPLDCPISVFGGADDPESKPDELAGWSKHTSRDHVISILPGDHFFLHQRPGVFLDALARELSSPGP